MARWRVLRPESSDGEGSETSGAVGVGAAAATWFVASHTVVFRRRRRLATGAEVLDGGARRRQESEISWVPAALRIATRAVKPLATHSLYKRKNFSLRERAACGGWLVALTPSQTTLAQDGAALESEVSEPAGRVVYCSCPLPFSSCHLLL
jgi:hypothetical protein